MIDHKAALEWASHSTSIVGSPDANLKAAYLELRELARAAYNSRILGYTDAEEILHAVMEEGDD